MAQWRNVPLPSSESRPKSVTLSVLDVLLGMLLILGMGTLGFLSASVALSAVIPAVEQLSVLEALLATFGVMFIRGIPAMKLTGSSK